MYNLKIKLIMLFLTCSSLLIAENDFVVSGELRNAYVNFDYKNSPNKPTSVSQGYLNSKGYYLVPKLSITTPSYANFSAKATVAGVTDFGINDKKYETGTYANNGPDYESYAILQEAYINYENDKNSFTIGREEFDTPMISNDDYYILANSFELAHYENKSLQNIVLGVGYFHKMSGVWDSGAYNTSDGGTDFYSMSEASYVSQADKDNADDSGIAYLAFEYENDVHQLQVWDYYAFDLYNTLFIQYDYLGKLDDFSYDLAFQFIDFSEVGDLKKNSFTEIYYNIFAVNFAGAFENGINFSAAISEFSSGDGTGATLGAWGGYPYFTFGLIHSWWNVGSFRNSTNYKLQAGYDFNNIKGLSCTFQALHVELDSKYSQSGSGEGQDYKDSYGAMLSYEIKNGLYASSTYELSKIDKDKDIDAFYLFAGYKF